MRLPTWLRLGLKIAGHGILGNVYEPSHRYEAACFILLRGTKENLLFKIIERASLWK